MTDLENRLKMNKISSKDRDYLPFCMQYIEVPIVVGYKNGLDLSQYTSVTFCTFKFVPLIDDGD